MVPQVFAEILRGYHLHFFVSRKLMHSTRVKANSYSRRLSFDSAIAADMELKDPSYSAWWMIGLTR